MALLILYFLSLDLSFILPTYISVSKSGDLNVSYFSLKVIHMMSLFSDSYVDVGKSALNLIIFDL